MAYICCNSIRDRDMKYFTILEKMEWEHSSMEISSSISRFIFTSLVLADDRLRMQYWELDFNVQFYDSINVFLKF